MNLHEALRNMDNSIAMIATELTVNPDMPINTGESIHALQNYPALEDILGTLSERYVQVAESSGFDEDYARVLLAGGIVAFNVLSRAAEIQMLEQSVDMQAD